MARIKDRWPDSSEAEGRVGDWLAGNGKIVLPVLALVVVGWFVVTRFL